MAKYTITHSCGHEQTHELFGKESDRQSKLDWMRNQECTACWREATQAAEDAQPITMTATLAPDTDTNGNPIVWLTLSGGTRPRKDEIKANGWTWGTLRPAGVMGSLSLQSEGMGWSKMYVLDMTAHKTVGEAVLASAPALKAEADKIGAKPVSKISPLDVGAAEKLQEKRAESKALEAKQAAAAAEIAKPVMPECYPSKTGKWNGKIYGSARGGYTVYIDNKLTKITADAAKAIQDYQTARDAYRKAVEEAKASVK